jgi:microcin C transport system substrate-binding protein
MKARRWFALALVLALSVFSAAAVQGQEGGTKVHALTLGDAPKYGPDFKHLDYVNPDAPKGGTVNYGIPGTFDSFNPFIIKGTPAGLSGLFETLTASTEDDILSEYGLIAESMEVAPDKSWIIYNLHPEARWHDGKPITAEDVVFSFNVLTEKGDPFYKAYYNDVVKAEALEERRVKFTFKSGGNRELPVIMGQLPVLPKHWWATRKFEDVVLEAPLGSGPYKLAAYDLGRSYTMERVPDYWGEDLPIKRGTDNYDRTVFTYYRDPEVQMEAFKSGRIDLRSENSAKRWATGYDFPVVKDGRVKKEKFRHVRPAGMQGFIMNTRRPYFAERTVREALIYAYDFEWANKTLFFGEYTRTRSYFENSELAARGLPSEEELKILEPLRGRIPDEVFTAEYNPPKTDGSGNNRDNLAKAAQLLDEAGWKVENGRRVKDGKPFAFEILIDDPAFERIVQPFVQNLQRIGITASVRMLIDASQYESRVEGFDFDMLVGGWGQSLSPGNEQREFWGSAAAALKGSRNYVGIKDPAIDTLVEQLINAQSRHELIIHCRALDRVLQWNHFVVPNWYLAADRIAYWNKFSMPTKRPDPPYSVGSSGWWIDPERAKTIEASKQQPETSPPAQEQAAQQVMPSDAGAAPKPADQASQAAAAPEQPEERGRSPLIYAGGAVLVVIVAYLLGRRRGRSS